MLKKENLALMGAIAGDFIGSVYEKRENKTVDFELFSRWCRFTDDTVMTLAVAETLLTGKSYVNTMQDFGRRYPNRGYGGTFHGWIFSEEPKPYNSWGNGSAMRASPVGYAFDNLAEVLLNARKSAEVSHDHPEGIKGAQAIAAAVFMARTGQSKSNIKEYVVQTFAYDLSKTTDEIRPNYAFDVSCQGSVPQAITAFLESTDYENAVRLAISIGGDSDTIGCMAGSIALAFYKEIPDYIYTTVWDGLTADLQDVVRRFGEKYAL